MDLECTDALSSWQMLKYDNNKEQIDGILQFVILILKKKLLYKYEDRLWC